MSVNDGGPAFPAHIAEINGLATNSGEFALPGMSLRDYFAGQVLGAIVTNGPLVTALRAKYGAHVTPHIADTAYEFADAMIEAREKRS